MSAAATVVVVGSVNRDYVCRVTAVPRPGQTLLGGELALGSGGKGGNQAVAAALLGAPTAMVACVGDDPDGQALVADLTSAGVDISGVVTVAETRTGMAFVMVADDGENAIVVAPGANGRLDARLVDTTLGTRLRDTDLVVLQAETPESGVRAAVDQARRVGARVVLNLAPYREIGEDLLAACDPIVVNEGEARSLLSRLADLDADAEQMTAGSMSAELGRRARSAVITLGAAGAIVAYGDSVEQVPAESVPVVDTTGAGDGFVGALAAALAAGRDLLDAVRLGVAVGSFAVGRAGAQASYPTVADLSAALGTDLLLNPAR
jgi:ribokinase